MIAGVVGATESYAYRLSDDGGATWIYGDTGDAGSSDGFTTPGIAEIAGPYFSEYVESTDVADNKAVEIYNPGSVAFSFSGCGVKVFANGSATGTTTAITAGASIAPGGVYVLCKTGIVGPTCDQTTGAGLWNGNDAVELLCGATCLRCVRSDRYRPGRGRLGHRRDLIGRSYVAARLRCVRRRPGRIRCVRSRHAMDGLSARHVDLPRRAQLPFAIGSEAHRAVMVPTMRWFHAIAASAALVACSGSPTTPMPDGNTEPFSLVASITGPLALTQTACSYDPFVLTVSLGQNVAPSADDTTVAIGGDDAGGAPFEVFADSTCTTPLTHLTLPAGQTTASATFFLIAGSPGATNVGAYHDQIAITRLGLMVYNAINIRTTQLASVPQAIGDGIADDTTSLNAAIVYASTTLPRDFPSGPLGTPQAIVYVPAGTYQIKGVTTTDALGTYGDVRLEISADAMFRESTTSTASANSLFAIDSPSPSGPVQNVTLIGVGTGADISLKQGIVAGWDVSHSFTVDVDPETTGADPNLEPLLIEYAQGVLVQNLFSIANDTNADATPPTFLNPFTKLYGHNDSPDSTHFYGPSQITYTNHYHLYGCLGCGAIQVQGGRTLAFSQIFSAGGIALRFETDRVGDYTLNQNGCKSLAQGGGGTNCMCSAAAPCALLYYSEIADAHADTISCAAGHSAVSFVPHNQVNETVDVQHVGSTNCDTAIETGDGTTDDRLPPGSFGATTVEGVACTGSSAGDDEAQHDAAGPQAWLAGQESSSPICWASAASVPMTITGCTMTGLFSGADPRCKVDTSGTCTAM